MSLFDVIKYPISDLPTDAEIDALPPVIRTYMSNALDRIDRPTSIKLLGTILRIMRRQPANQARVVQIIEGARKKLEEL